MIHSWRISRLYYNHSNSYEVWYRMLNETEEFGAFVFLPDKELEWEWWTLPEIMQYIQDGGLDDEEMLEGIYDFEFGEEFLVLVIEYVGGPGNQEAYFHRMIKVRMN